MSTEIRLYFDACCFIDLVQSRATYPLENGRDSHVFSCRKILDAARNGDVQVYTSTLTFVECTHVKDLEQQQSQQTVINENVKRLFRGMLLSGRSGVTPVQPTPSICELARDFKWNYGATLKPMDATHVATAHAMRCTHFVTTDQSLKNESFFTEIGIIVCSGDKVLSLLPDKYKQLVLERDEGVNPTTAMRNIPA